MLWNAHHNHKSFVFIRFWWLAFILYRFRSIVLNDRNKNHLNQQNIDNKYWANYRLPNAAGHYSAMLNSATHTRGACIHTHTPARNYRAYSSFGNVKLSRRQSNTSTASADTSEQIITWRGYFYSVTLSSATVRAVDPNKIDFKLALIT